MKKSDNNSTHCVVARGAVNFARRIGLIDSTQGDLEECQIVESVRQLMAMGLSAKEIEDLDIRQPMAQAIFDNVEQGHNDGDNFDKAARAVDATLDVVVDETRKLDMELQMLRMRKKALEKRAKVLRKIADCLQSNGNDLMAA
ncbi:MAG: hypothetical protein A2Z18_02305 [Armatimonadetes bacterium RBG_16_58_9]|nr:MAG: hypothetical protein A2Z18_02305 [Armatimonadetes bacterium RBG_16_58_9]